MSWWASTCHMRCFYLFILSGQCIVGCVVLHCTIFLILPIYICIWGGQNIRNTSKYEIWNVLSLIVLSIVTPVATLSGVYLQNDISSGIHTYLYIEGVALLIFSALYESIRLCRILYFTRKVTVTFKTKQHMRPHSVMYHMNKMTQPITAVVATLI